MRTLRKALANLVLAFGGFAGIVVLGFGTWQRDMVHIVAGGMLALICIAIEIREALEDE
jgi:hypothetical protein